ncbi:sensor histidine kinase [Mangrovicella endophytica]|uniref:sensor histidine kinase n=1 Tax=Mangrovicella endophytica TaxID=2066697 RepID=UPI001FE08810|nr:HAMP domain-containing sensor histidine kinase [Mangrovicella endophytica]
MMSDANDEAELGETTDSGNQHVGDQQPKRPVVAHRLSVRILWITVLAVMAAEVLIFVPSIAHFRHSWLHGKIETVAVVGLALKARVRTPGQIALDPAQEADLLRAVDAGLIALTGNGASRLLATSGDLAAVDMQIDLRFETVAEMITGAFDTMLFGGSRMMRVLGPVGDGTLTAEAVMSDHSLRMAMLRYARNIFLLSLCIAAVAAFLVYLAIMMMLVRPIGLMTAAMIHYSEKPDDPSRIIAAPRRLDEIGLATVELASMQTRLSTMLREQRHLADLGLAVSKINHDLRNILASAQLISDRLSDLPDPRVQRLAPMLLRSLDRALSYTQSVLAYGKAVEAAPIKRRVRLRQLVDDVYQTLVVAPDAAVELVNAVPETFEVDVDPDQFYRMLSNLCRNSVQALEADTSPAVVRRISIAASNEAAMQLIAVEDSGPGLSPRARENLFKAFRGSTRAGGTGLGLAIAAEIVRVHGGSITLSDRPDTGARFEIRLPRRIARSEPAVAA